MEPSFPVLPTPPALALSLLQKKPISLPPVSSLLQYATSRRPFDAPTSELSYKERTAESAKMRRNQPIWKGNFAEPVKPNRPVCAPQTSHPYPRPVATRQFPSLAWQVDFKCNVVSAYSRMKASGQKIPHQGPGMLSGSNRASPYLNAVSCQQHGLYHTSLPRLLPKVPLPTILPINGEHLVSHCRHYISGPSQSALVPVQGHNVCPLCGKAFGRLSTLRVHSRSHTGEKPFMCPNACCRKAFSTCSNMKRHERRCRTRLSLTVNRRQAQKPG